MSELVAPEAPAPLFSLSFQQNPYPTYAYHRNGPAVQPYLLRPGLFMFFRYADCVTLFRDPRLSSKRPAHMLIGTTDGLDEFAPFVDHMHRWLLQLDGARHTVLRKHFNPLFSPARIENLRRQVQTVVFRLLDDLGQRPTADLIGEFAYPLPVRIICELLGVPSDFQARCTDLTNDIATWFSTIGRTPTLARVAYEAIVELEDFFRSLIRARKSSGDHNLLDEMVAIASAGNMTQDELLAQCVMMLFGGHETTRHLIGNSMFSFLESPSTMKLLRSDLCLVPNAVEEVLRFESPIQAIPRGVMEAFEYKGTAFPSGSTLLFMIGAAQRDAEQFANADELEIRRQHIRHLGFGGDVHTCLGVALARMQSRIAVTELLTRYPRLSRASSNTDWGTNFAIRGLKALEVNLH